MSPPNPNLTDRLSRLLERASASHSDSEVEARRAEHLAAASAARVRELRAGWNAPRRHLAARLRHEGPWAERLAGLQAKLGTGCLIGLIGNRGAGKTQLGIELMKLTTERGRPALFRTAMELLMRFKASYRAESKETELDVLRAHRRPALLVIDEIARRAETAWENNLLFELLNQRYADLTDTIVTCNLSAEEFAASLGPSLVSRMREGGGIVQCDWPSFRG